MTIRTVVDARKVRFDADEAWELVRGADRIITAKGKVVHRWNPRSDDKATILQHLMGPSGNLRAPTLRAGNQFIVGFQPELYGRWLEMSRTGVDGD